jgi:hypothetical protein
MKEITLKRIKSFERLCVVLVVYWIIYNWYFGFNIHPTSEAEKTCDLIFQGVFGLTLGTLISAIIGFMKYILND